MLNKEQLSFLIAEVDNINHILMVYNLDAVGTGLIQGSITPENVISVLMSDPELLHFITADIAEMEADNEYFEPEKWSSGREDMARSIYQMIKVKPGYTKDERWHKR